MYRCVNISVELSQWILIQKFTKPFTLYIFLKLKSSGRIEFCTDIIEDAKKSLNYKCNKSVYNNINQLVERDFVGFDKQKRVLYIRSFEYLRKSYGLKRKEAVEFSISELFHMKAFLISAVITNLIIEQKRKLRASERHEGRSSQEARCFYPVANLALAKVLNISISSASNYKAIAKQSGYIDIISISKDLGIPANEKENLKKAFPEKSHLIIVKDDVLHEVKPDRIRSHMKLRYRKKIDTYNQGGMGGDSIS